VNIIRLEARDVNLSLPENSYEKAFRPSFFEFEFYKSLDMSTSCCKLFAFPLFIIAKPIKNNTEARDRIKFQWSSF